MLYPVMFRVSLEVVISASLLAYLQIRKSTFKVSLTYLLKTKISATEDLGPISSIKFVRYILNCAYVVF